MLKLRAIGLFCFAMIFLACSDNSEDARVWNELQKNPSVTALDAFLKDYPNSNYRAQALKKKEEYQWQQAKLDKTAFNYKKYLEDYPDGKYSEEARQAMLDLPSVNIRLEQLLSRSFVGHIDYGGRQVQVLSLKFRLIEEVQENQNELQANEDFKFMATVNTTDLRKEIPGFIQMPQGIIMFEEEPSEGNEAFLGLTEGRIYSPEGRILLESTDPKQYWVLR